MSDMRHVADHDAAAFNRRDLLKGGGAVIVGFSFAGAAAAPAAAARGEVAGPPDPAAIDTWIALHADNTATLYFGKCELGQGNTTGLLQIAGEELDLDMSQLKWVGLDTNVTRTRARRLQVRPFIVVDRRCVPQRQKRARLSLPSP